MLSNQEMCSLRNDDSYILTYSYNYNRKYAKPIIESGGAYLALSIGANGSLSCSVDLRRIIWLVLKCWFIAKEIGEFRNIVIENAFNTGVNTSPILDLIASEYWWVEARADKMSKMRKITAAFLSDSRVAQLFYDKSHLENKEEVYKRISLDIDIRFKEAIDFLRGAERY